MQLLSAPAAVLIGKSTPLVHVLGAGPWAALWPQHVMSRWQGVEPPLVAQPRYVAAQPCYVRGGTGHRGRVKAGDRVPASPRLIVCLQIGSHHIQ